MWRWLSLTAAVAAVWYAGWLLMAPASVPGTRAAADAGSRAPRVTADPPASAPPARPPTKAVTPSASHRGTAMDGHVRIGNDGRVKVTLGLRRRFDYVLTARPRPGAPDARQLLARSLRREDLDGSVVTRTLALFDRYVRYRRAVAELPGSPRSVERLQEAFQRRRALRQRILGPAMAAAFFGHEAPLERHAIALRRWLDSDSAPERARQPPDRLRQQLPSGLRRAHQRSRLALTLRERVQRLRRKGADRARIHAVRAAVAGPSAAQRLADLDRRRNRWRERLAAYRRARERLLSTPGLAPGDRQAAVDALLRERFDPHEARRVRALERTDEARGHQ